MTKTNKLRQINQKLLPLYDLKSKNLTYMNRRKKLNKKIPFSYFSMNKKKSPRVGRQ